MATQISFWEKKQIGFSLLRDFFSVKIKMREFFYLGLVRRVLVGLVQNLHCVGSFVLRWACQRGKKICLVFNAFTNDWCVCHTSKALPVFVLEECVWLFFFFSSVHCISFFRILFVWNKIIVIEKNITHLRRMWRNFVDGVMLRHTLSSETCDFFTAFSWIIIKKKNK